MATTAVGRPATVTCKCGKAMDVRPVALSKKGPIINVAVCYSWRPAQVPMRRDRNDWHVSALPLVWQLDVVAGRAMSAADCLDGVPRRCWVVRMFTPTCALSASFSEVSPPPSDGADSGEVGLHGSADCAPNPPHDEENER